MGKVFLVTVSGSLIEHRIFRFSDLLMSVLQSCISKKLVHFIQVVKFIAMTLFIVFFSMLLMFIGFVMISDHPFHCYVGDLYSFFSSLGLFLLYFSKNQSLKKIFLVAFFLFLWLYIYIYNIKFTT